MSSSSIFGFIKTKVTILDLIGEYTTLKKAGSYWKGHCPFHFERTPSFTVSPHKEIYYCFGCQETGDVVNFIARAEQLTPWEAAQFLVEKYNLDVPSEFQEKKGKLYEKKHYYEMYKHVAEFCHQELLTNKEALAYLARRNISQESIRKYLLGYFPAHAGIKSLIAFCHKQSFFTQDLGAAHIIQEQKNGWYSPFEDRIIFPIKDSMGRYCGFGGRIFKEHDDRAKYYNSHDHELFNKSSILFGFDSAKKSIQSSGQAYIVEGYIDCIAMVQAGYQNTIATLGTSCTAEHLSLISRYASHLIFVYDGDAAGHNALARITKLCWSFTLELSVITLPESEDPASFLLKNKDMHRLIEKKQDIFNYFIEKTGKSQAETSFQEKMETIEHLITFIGMNEDPLKQSLLFQKAAEALHIPLESLYAHKDKKKSKKIADTPSQKSVIDSNLSKLEKKLLCVILNEKLLLSSEDEEFIINSLPDTIKNILKKAVYHFTQRGQRNFISLFEYLDESEKKIVSTLVFDNNHLSPEDTVEELVIQFYRKQWKIALNNVKLKLAGARGKEAEQAAIVLEEFHTLKQKMLRKGLI